VAFLREPPADRGPDPAHAAGDECDSLAHDPLLVGCCFFSMS
jgi:hypothetical protein